jgi:hypothetical protein
VFLEDSVDLLILNNFAQLRESVFDILPGYLFGLIYVELIEKSLQPLTGEELLDLDRGSKELTVIDFSILRVIDFFYDLL